MADKSVVHIVDDEDAVRRSASFLLRTAGYAVTTHASGVAFLKEAKGLEPGCVLLDVRMPDMDGLAVQAEMIARGLALPVVVLTGHGDVSVAVRAMKAGAVDFLEKPFEQADLIDAIERGLERLQVAETKVLRANEAATILAGLSPRELDVFKGMVRGLPNKSIAFDLGISPRTVEVHRANLMTKLGVRNLSEALRLAFAAGLDASIT
ncbi:response regulator transcription factor [Caulobacter sp. RL271]|jgi:two-component system response regulator FixJ|uniref:Response regulator transcription factor n=1 Tax=Caulobacter segnis TaxID=88688 RepID=A0ABY4ZPF8_9CAUL|nr:response regulator transcription factor [Caulobacter segnis]USQ94481.1 response regulator transcription factor [Caulobacter segnis]